MTIWVVRVEDNLYVRSAYGADNPWFRRAKAGGAGRIRAGRIERDVTFAALELNPPTPSTLPTSPNTPRAASSVGLASTGLLGGAEENAKP